MEPDQRLDARQLFEKGLQFEVGGSTPKDEVKVRELFQARTNFRFCAAYQVCFV